MTRSFLITSLTLAMGCNLDEAPAGADLADEQVWSLEDAELETIGAAFAPVVLSLTAPTSAVEGETVTITVRGANPGEQVRLFLGSGVDRVINPAVLGYQSVGFEPTAAPSRSALADAGGVATFEFPAPAAGVEGFFIAAVRRGGTDGAVSNVEAVRTFEAGTARVRIVHASPDAPNVDVYANGSLLLADVPFRANSGYLTVPAITYDIDIRAAGADPSSTPVFTVPGLALEEATTYTAIATGFLNSTAPADSFRVLPIVEDYGTPAYGEVRTIVVHAAPDAPSVDIDVGNDGSSEIAPLDRFEAVGPVPLPAFGFAVGIAGGDFDFTIPWLPSGAEVMAIASGSLVAPRSDAEEAFALFALVDDAPATILQDPRIFAFHASPDAGVVDLKVAGATVVNDLAYRDLAGPISVPPGSYDVEIFDGAGSTFVTNWTSPTLTAGRDYLAIAAGEVGSGTFRVIAVPDDAPLSDAGLLSITIVHAASDVFPVTAGLFDRSNSAYTPATGPIAYGEVASPLYFPDGNYTLGFGDGAGTGLGYFDATIGIFGAMRGSRAVAVVNGTVADGDLALTLLEQSPGEWGNVGTIPAVFLSP